MSVDQDEIHIEAKRCADLIGVTPYSDMRSFVERAVIVALSSERQSYAELMDEVRRVLEPFANVAERDIGESETDNDQFIPISWGRARARILTVGDLRAARALLSKLGGENG